MSDWWPPDLSSLTDAEWAELRETVAVPHDHTCFEGEGSTSNVRHPVCRLLAEVDRLRELINAERAAWGHAHICRECFVRSGRLPIFNCNIGKTLGAAWTEAKEMVQI